MPRRLPPPPHPELAMPQIPVTLNQAFRLAVVLALVLTRLPAHLYPALLTVWAPEVPHPAPSPANRWPVLMPIQAPVPPGVAVEAVVPACHPPLPDPPISPPTHWPPLTMLPQPQAPCDPPLPPAMYHLRLVPARVVALFHTLSISESHPARRRPVQGPPLLLVVPHRVLLISARYSGPSC